MVKVIVTTPAETPSRVPVEPTVAIAVLLLAHVPPPVASCIVVVFSEASHTEAVPVMGNGSAFMVNGAVW